MNKRLALVNRYSSIPNTIYIIHMGYGRMGPKDRRERMGDDGGKGGDGLGRWLKCVVRDQNSSDLAQKF